MTKKQATASITSRKISQAYVVTEPGTAVSVNIGSIVVDGVDSGQKEAIVPAGKTWSIKPPPNSTFVEKK